MNPVQSLIGSLCLVVVIMVVAHMRSRQMTNNKAVILNEMARNMAIASFGLLCTVLAGVVTESQVMGSVESNNDLVALALLLVILPSYCLAAILTRQTIARWNWLLAEVNFE